MTLARWRQGAWLAVLGTDPSAQGQSLASAALAPVLSQCDADGQGAYLECSKDSNVNYYSRQGFRVTEDLQLPHGPKLWAICRDARA